MSKRIILTLFAVFTLLFSMSTTFAFVFDETVDVTITGVFDQSNVLQTTLPNTPVGSEIQVSAAIVENYNFAFWVVNGIVDETRTASTSFIVSTNMELQVVYYPTGSHAVVFVDSNGALLKADFVLDGGTATPPTNLPTKPNMIVNATNPWSTSFNEVTSSRVVKLQYQIEIPEAYTVTINGNSEFYGYNDVVVLNSQDENFTHWEIDGFIASYHPEYSFTVFGNHTVVAKTIGAGYDLPLVTMYQVNLRESYDSYIGQIYLPSDYQLVEWGFVVDGVSRASKSIHPDTNEFLLSIPENQVTNVYAYAIVKFNNELSVVDSTPKTLSNELVDWFDARGVFVSPTKETFQSNAKSGGTQFTVSDTVDTITRAFRLITASTQTSSTVLSEAVTKGFTYSDDPTIHNELHDYWHQYLMNTSNETIALDGGVDNDSIRILFERLYEYMIENNDPLDSSVKSSLETIGIFEGIDSQELDASLTKYGIVSNALTQSLLTNLAQYIDSSATSASEIVNVLYNVKLITSTTYWDNIFADQEATASGGHLHTILTNFNNYVNTTLTNYQWLLTEGVIDQADYDFWIYNSYSGAVVSNALIKEILLKFALEIQIDATYETAVDLIASKNLTSNPTVWNNAVSNPEGTTALFNMNTFVTGAVNYFKAHDPIDPNASVLVLSEELLTYFTAQGIFVGTTFNAQYFYDNARVGGGALNITETKNMLTRAFRKITLGGHSAAQVIPAAVNSFGFTFDDDPTDHAAQYDYWQNQIMTVANATILANGGINNEMLRVLMVRIYEVIKP